MNTIPCKNCITFPICKAQAIDLVRRHKNRHAYKEIGGKLTIGIYYIYEDLLSHKCTIIKNWVDQR